MSKHCCDRMDLDLNQTCDKHPDRYKCPDSLIETVRGGYGLIIHDGGRSVVEMAFCPWCGAKLPPIADLPFDTDEDQAERAPQSAGERKLGLL